MFENFKFWSKTTVTTTTTQPILYEKESAVEKCRKRVRPEVQAFVDLFLKAPKIYQHYFNVGEWMYHHGSVSQSLTGYTISKEKNYPFINSGYIFMAKGQYIILTFEEQQTVYTDIANKYSMQETKRKEKNQEIALEKLDEYVKSKSTIPS